MDISDLKIGRDGTFLPPFKSNFNSIKSYEEDGYDSIFIADHIVNWIPESIWSPDITNLAAVYKSPHLIYEAFTMVAAAALHSKKVRIGTGVTETFRRNPAVLPQTIMTLDHLSNGRIIVGLGAGEKENIVPFGIKWEQPVSRLEEAIEIIRLLWQKEEKVDFDGKFWKLKNARLGLKPSKKGRFPPIWIAAHGERMLDITGRLGDGWFPIYLNPESYKDKLNLIYQSAKREGRSKDEITPALYLNVIIDENHEDCDRMLKMPLTKNHLLTLYGEDFRQYGIPHPLGENVKGVVDYIPLNYDKKAVLNLLDKIPDKMCQDFYVNGTPDQVIKQIENYANCGAKHIVLFNYTILCDIKKIPTSNKCLKKVIDYFKEK
jgi:phthiodiolone/phenolphthiodiolone dimycocerosates ketoreductase